MNEDNWCSICLEENDENLSILLECNHTFHKDCINEWKNLSKKCYYTCPICQKKFFKRYCINISNCVICLKEYYKNTETIINIPEETTNNYSITNKKISICCGLMVLYIGIVSIVFLVSSEKN